MAWTEITRRQYARRIARHASDMTDREWVLVEPFLPMPRRLGRPRTTGDFVPWLAPEAPLLKFVAHHP